MRLSESQETLLYEVSCKWINSTLEKKPFNKPLIQTFFDLLYWGRGFREPEIHYADGPLAAQSVAFDLRLIAKNWKNLGTSILNDMELRIVGPVDVPRKISCLILGKAKMVSLAKIHIEMQLKRSLEQVYEEFSQDFRNVQWCSFYDFCLEAGYIKKRRGIIDAYCEYVFNSGVFFAICEAAHVIVCPNPTEINFNGAGQLHFEDGSAVSWDDGYRLYFLDGMPIPEKSLTLPAQAQNNLFFLFREKTSEIKREILNRLSVNVSTHDFRIKMIDQWQTKWSLYELITVGVPRISVALTYLKMLNPSTGEWHIESVPEVRSCKEALAWRDGETEYIVPAKLT